jgi:hypothetical protein
LFDNALSLTGGTSYFQIFSFAHNKTTNWGDWTLGQFLASHTLCPKGPKQEFNNIYPFLALEFLLDSKNCFLLS